MDNFIKQIFDEEFNQCTLYVYEPMKSFSVGTGKDCIMITKHILIWGNCGYILVSISSQFPCQNVFCVLLDKDFTLFSFRSVVMQFNQRMMNRVQSETSLKWLDFVDSLLTKESGELLLKKDFGKILNKCYHLIHERDEILVF